MLIVMQRVVGQCDAIATGAERPVLKLLLLLLLGMLVGVEGVAKVLLAGTLILDPATCRPRFGNRVSCLFGGPPGAGVGTPPRDADSSALPGELLGALKLLQTVMSAEDFSYYEKLVVRLLLKRKGPRNESSCSGKKCNLKTGCGSKKLVMLNRLPSLKRMQQNNADHDSKCARTASRL